MIELKTEKGNNIKIIFILLKYWESKSKREEKGRGGKINHN